MCRLRYRFTYLFIFSLVFLVLVTYILFVSSFFLSTTVSPKLLMFSEFNWRILQMIHKQLIHKQAGHSEYM